MSQLGWFALGLFAIGFMSLAFRVLRDVSLILFLLAIVFTVLEVLL